MATNTRPMVAEAFDVRPGVGPGDRAAEGDDDQLEQVVNARPLDTRIRKIFKRCKNCHEPLSHRKTLRELVLHEESKQGPCLHQAACNTAED